MEQICCKILGLGNFTYLACLWEASVSTSNTAVATQQAYTTAELNRLKDRGHRLVGDEGFRHRACGEIVPSHEVPDVHDQECEIGKIKALGFLPREDGRYTHNACLTI